MHTNNVYTLAVLTFKTHIYSNFSLKYIGIDLFNLRPKYKTNKWNTVFGSPIYISVIGFTFTLCKSHLWAFTSIIVFYFTIKLLIYGKHAIWNEIFPILQCSKYCKTELFITKLSGSTIVTKNGSVSLFSLSQVKQKLIKSVNIGRTF